MRRNDLSITEPSSFGAPIFSALIVHAVVGFLLLTSWNFSINQPEAFELPKNIRAEFVQVERARPEPEIVQAPPAQPPKPAPKPVEAPKPAPPKPAPVVKPEPTPVVKAPEPVVEPPIPEAINISQQTPEPAPQPEPKPQPVEEPVQAAEEDLFGDLLAGLAAEEQAISNRIEEITQSQIRAAQIQSEIDNFQQNITSQIEERWSRPAELLLMDVSNIEAVVSVELLPTGELQRATITRSSGNANYDQSVIRAIERVRRFAVPSDPELFEAGGFRNLNITFRPEDLMKS